ncbi:P2Y purinoceptor 2-like [Ruditapes philippinarum]|uniref:P2Y purinoceptor 2-like n=1 Tax=Ruditapes philippinarum TaxID=129788 RepID=UPI00295BF5D1|nr:P2Y purinoceptor 2-like [Ruditapes philippinarum]
MKRLNSSATYLAGITICDIVYQLLHTFFYLKYFWGLPAIGRQVLCQLWNVLYLIPQYASQLLVLGFTMERFISIYKPFHGERFSKRQRAPKIVIIITVIVVILAMPQAYFWTVDADGFCEIGSGDELLEIYTIWSFVTESTIFFVVPALTLILNIFVLRETHKVINRHRSLNFETNGPSRIHKSRNYRPATKTLLCISFFRILTQLPVSITYTIQNLDAFSFGKFMPLEDMRNDAQWRIFISYWGARVFIETIGASHFALSIFIFYASTKQFRNEIGKILNLMKCGAGRQSAQWKHRPGRCTSSDFVYMSSFYKTSDLSVTNNSS